MNVVCSNHRFQPNSIHSDYLLLCLTSVFELFAEFVGWVSKGDDDSRSREKFLKAGYLCCCPQFWHPLLNKCCWDQFCKPTKPTNNRHDKRCQFRSCTGDPFSSFHLYFCNRHFIIHLLRATYIGFHKKFHWILIPIPG